MNHFELFAATCVVALITMAACSDSRPKNLEDCLMDATRAGSGEAITKAERICRSVFSTSEKVPSGNLYAFSQTQGDCEGFEVSRDGLVDVSWVCGKGAHFESLSNGRTVLTCPSPLDYMAGDARAIPVRQDGDRFSLDSARWISGLFRTEAACLDANKAAMASFTSEMNPWVDERVPELDSMSKAEKSKWRDSPEGQSFKAAWVAEYRRRFRTFDWSNF